MKQEYSAEVVKELIELAAKKAGTSATHYGFLKLSESINATAQDASTPRIKQKYLNDTYNKAIKKSPSEKVTFNGSYIDAISQYLGYSNFLAFEKDVNFSYESTKKDRPYVQKEKPSLQVKKSFWEVIPKIQYAVLVRLLPAFCLLIICSIFIIEFIPRIRVMLGWVTDTYGGLPFLLLGVLGLTYAASILIREISKYAFEKPLFRKNGFPTTYLILYQHPKYSNSFKSEYRSKIFRELGVKIPSQDEELKNVENSVKILNEVTKRIILTVGNGRLVHKHLIWYGFIRNSLGGIVLLLPLSVLSTAYSYWLGANQLIGVSTFSFLFSSILLLFGKKVLIHNAELYAHQLFSEYLQK